MQIIGHPSRTVGRHGRAFLSLDATFKVTKSQEVLARAAAIEEGWGPHGGA
jgi:hypothetical protein